MPEAKAVVTSESWLIPMFKKSICLLVIMNTSCFVQVKILMFQIEIYTFSITASILEFQGKCLYLRSYTFYGLKAYAIYILKFHEMARFLFSMARVDIYLCILTGVLLYGPPGTGKTLLARACAAQTKSTFLKLAGPQLVQMFIGDGAKLVRDAFAMAKEKQPAIIFIDELDAIGMKL